jgi:hypothetical protein
LQSDGTIWFERLVSIFLVATLAFTLLSLTLLKGLIWNYVKRSRARHWMTNHGRIELVSVEIRKIKYFRYYICRLDYSYSVHNDYHSGFMEKMFFRESSADKFAETMKDQMVFVRANPRKPERSALLADDQPGGWPA